MKIRYNSILITLLINILFNCDLLAQTDSCSCVANFDDLVSKKEDNYIAYHQKIKGRPFFEIQYEIFKKRSVKENNFSFPTEFKIFDPFLIATEYEGLYNGSQEFNNTLILEFSPKANTINCYPRGWFNKSNVDLGYQWITRAIRDSNGVIHGQGIRISDFTLDDTGTQLKK